MTKILSIGLGGVGAIAAYTLQTNNPHVEVTVIIRSDYDTVTSRGYSIKYMDIGNLHQNEPVEGFKPTNVVKSLYDASDYGPFDYIVVSTKAIAQESDNIWDQIYSIKDKLIHSDGSSSIVLIQNGIDIEVYYSKLLEHVTMISGVSYISSINTKGSIEMYAPDELLFGLFDPTDDDSRVKKLIELYSHDKNKILVDENVRCTRFKKLLYNAAFNTLCCLTDSDMKVMYELGVVNDTIEPLMQEIRLVANQDLKQRHLDKLIEQNDIDFMLHYAETIDVPQHYQPSMLVDFRNKRQIELESISGNVIQIYKTINPASNVKANIPYLNFLYYLLKIIQHKLINSLI